MAVEKIRFNKCRESRDGLQHRARMHVTLSRVAVESFILHDALQAGAQVPADGIIHPPTTMLSCCRPGL